MPLQGSLEFLGCSPSSLYFDWLECTRVQLCVSSVKYAVYTVLVILWTDLKISGAIFLHGSLFFITLPCRFPATSASQNSEFSLLLSVRLLAAVLVALPCVTGQKCFQAKSWKIVAHTKTDYTLFVCSSRF